MQSALLSTASRDHSCPTEQLQREEVGLYTERVSGRGKENLYVYRDDRWTSALDRAAFELDCPKQELTTKIFSQWTVGVSGCTRRAVYVRTWSTEWRLDSAEEARTRDETPSLKR